MPRVTLFGGDGSREPGGDRVEAHHGQGLTLVHFSAPLKRFLWDMGAFRVLEGVLGVLGGIKEDQGLFRL
jgi:hypothetical protein